MIIPEFWAEARIHIPRSKKNGQLTVRRFGWSETSQAEAQALAETRAAEALKRIQTGERLVRREHKQAYNGATGTPIREEVLARHGTTVITRNSYGAHCLNTPQVLFADIDFEGRGSSGFWLKLVLGLLGSIALMLAYPPHNFWGFVLSIGASFVIVGLLSAMINAVSLRLRGGKEKIARTQIDQFVARHPEMMLRLYRTPAGFRLLAMHALFDPCSEEVAGLFRELGVDEVYAAMCKNQACFRARLTAKPWRVGMSEHIRPRPGVWPVAQEKLPMRHAWVERYEDAARGFASCSYVSTLGTGPTHAEAERVRALHDELSGALSGRTIA